MVQKSFKYTVTLPDLSLWGDVPAYKTLSAYFTVQIRQYGCLWNSDTKPTTLQCFLTSKGFLVIYAKETAATGKCKGYAAKLSTADNISITSNKKCRERNYTVKISFPFGAILLTLDGEQMSLWLPRINAALNDRSIPYHLQSTPCHCATANEPSENSIHESFSSMRSSTNSGDKSNGFAVSPTLAAFDVNVGVNVTLENERCVHEAVQVPSIQETQWEASCVSTQEETPIITSQSSQVCYYRD